MIVMSSKDPSQAGTSMLAEMSRLEVAVAKKRTGVDYALRISATAALFRHWLRRAADVRATRYSRECEATTGSALASRQRSASRNSASSSPAARSR